MKLEDQENDILFETDDEENRVEIGDHDDITVPSSPISRNNSIPWPQSYRKSVDILTGVTPPGRSFIHQITSQTSLSSSFSSFYKRRHNSSVLDSISSIKQPLIINKDENSFKSDVLSSQKILSISDLRFAEQNRCSFLQSVLNGINMLCGVGLLTMPYAVKEGGWLGLFIFFFFGIIACYTGILLLHLDSPVASSFL